MSIATRDRGTTRVVAVVGPTAVGKTPLAERLALELGGEIVSADSMQVYRHMDIGTAKTPAAQRAVTHHCVDLVDPGTPFSAALYQQAARDAIRAIRGRDRVPVVCGGTGLYVRAALDDWEFPGGETASLEREALEAEAREAGAAALHARLAEVDKPSADLIHPANVRRTIRALEMAGRGDSYARQARRFSVRQAYFDTVYLGLTMEREALYRRIDERVDAMLDRGLLDEVDTLLQAGFRNALTAAQAIGYKELVPVIEEGAPLAHAAEDIKRSTRRYAKRQMSWFRADPRISWIDVTGLDAEGCVRAAFTLLESEKPPIGPPAPGTWRLPVT